MLIDIGHFLDLCPKSPVEAERIQNPHFVIIMLFSDWESQLKKITNESVHTGAGNFHDYLLQILFCCLLYTRENESL